MKEKQGNPKMHGRKRKKQKIKRKNIYTKCTLNSLNSENSLAEKDKQKDRPKKRKQKSRYNTQDINNYKRKDTDTRRGD